MQTSHLIQVVMCSLALNPTVNKQNTTYRYIQYFASSDCLPLQNLMHAAHHGGTTNLTHSYNFKINSRSHQCQSTVMKAQFAMKLKLHVFFIFSTESIHDSLSVLYSNLLPHLHSLYPTHTSALCSQGHSQT